MLHRKRENHTGDLPISKSLSIHADKGDAKTKMKSRIVRTFTVTVKEMQNPAYVYVFFSES